MKKQYFLLIFFLSLVLVGFSQQNKDSLKNPVTQIFMQSVVEDLNNFPLNYQYYAVKDYTASSLYFKTEDGNYKDGRAPETINNFGLNTQGVYRNKKGVIFFGDISIEKIYYKNLKWNLSYQLPENGIMEDPHYFGVSKGGDWNNQHYNLNGGFIIPVNSKISLLVNAKYQLYNKYRVDLDPRAQITYNTLNLNVGLGYSINARHHLKASLLYGYTHVDNAITFSNNFQNSPVNYDIYVKWLSGYGSFSSPFKNSTQRRMKHYITTLGYSFTTEKLTVLADVKYEKNNQITYRNNNVQDVKDRGNYFATYEPYTIEFNSVFLYKKSELKHLKFNIRGYSKSGDNYLESKQGKSYSVSEKNVLFSLAYLKFKNNKDYWDMGISTEVNSANQFDALATTTSNYTNLEISNYLLRSFPISNTVAISPYLKSAVRFNLSNKFIQGNKQYLESIEENDFPGLAQRDFYSEVIIPNNELFTASELNLNTGASIQVKTNQVYNLSINIQGGLLLPLQEINNFASSNLNRFEGLLGLTITY